MKNEDFWSKIESTDWLEYIYLLLKYSCDILNTFLDKKTVIIHCPEGDDYTTQLISITELLFDPYYRTLNGFIVLVEKEWLSFGHQFGVRNGISASNSLNEDNQRCPSFVLFLDTVHQILEQFPHAFEFNNEFLLFLAKSSLNNLYGTFIFNNAKERENYDAQNKSASVWSDILSVRSKYINKYFDSEKAAKVIFPNYAQYNLTFWTEFFMMDSSYIKNNSFFLDNRKSIEFKNVESFYNWEKSNDDKKLKDIENKNNSIINSLIEVYNV